MLSGKMLPIHFPPAPDELLTSWYVRLAHANWLKAETFGTVLWGRQRQLWNRDIDRLSPKWLVWELAERTGTPFEVAWSTTLKSYEGKLFTELHPTGISPWILPVKMYHRKHKWPGLQFCPECLKEDAEPYFRKRWRVALYTTCNRHGVLLCDRCPECGEPVVFYRRELGKAKQTDFKPLSLCYSCEYDLRLAKGQKAVRVKGGVATIEQKATLWLEAPAVQSMDVDFYLVLHQICKLLLSEKHGEKLRGFVRRRCSLGAGQSLASSKQRRAFFEHHSILERNHVLKLAYWLLFDRGERINDAIEAKALVFNKLYRDLRSMPKWYYELMCVLTHRTIPKFRVVSTHQ